MAQDLISRAAALDVLVTSPNFHTTLTRIEELPAVDAAPVVHGRWQEYHAKARGYSKVYYQHSCTPLLYDSPYYYCPNCGAKMDGEA